MKNKILAAIVLTLLVSILLVSCGGSTKLTAPTGISYDGMHITWSAVDGATGYKVQINDGEAYSVTSTVYPYTASGNFKVTVTAISEGKKTAVSEPSSVDFKPIGEIGELRVDANGVVTWDAVDLANAYEIKIDGVKQENIHVTTYDKMPVGRHSIQVRPIIDGDKTYYASWSKSVVVEILGEVAKDDITYADGYIKWKPVSGAQFYEVLVNGTPIISDCRTVQVEYDPLNTSFEVNVKAIGNHTSTYDGKLSETKKFAFLDSVTNLQVQDGILTWDSVNGANGYQIKLNGVLYGKVLTECRFEGLTQNAPTDISIMPISNDATYFSSWSPVKSVLLLPAPVIGWNEYGADGQANSNVYWNTISNAGGYAVEVTYPDGTVQTYNFGETQRFFQEAFLQSGTYLIRAKALAPQSSSNVYDSGYSSPIKVIRLDAPKPAANNYIVSNPKDLTEGFTVTFDKVTGAMQYNLYKDGVLDKTIAGANNQFSVKDLSNAQAVGEQNINFSIQSVGAGAQTIDGQTVVTLSSLTEKSLDFVITILATPKSPTIDGFTYQYGTVEHSFGYVIDIGGQSYTSGETFYDLSMVEAGNYAIKVCSIGNGTTTLPSDYSAPINVNRLAAPTGIRIDTSEVSEGSLVFNPVQHATGYVIVFDNNGQPIPVTDIDNMNQYITEQGTTVYLQSTANYFNNDGTVYYMTSRPGPTANFIKLAAPTFGDVKFMNNHLVWNAPSNINTMSYTPTYEVYGAGNMLYTGEKNGTSMDVSFLAGGSSYEFQVKAIGDGTTYINSDKSLVVSIHKLATPDVKLAEGGYQWNIVPGTVTYAVYVDGVLVKTISTGEDLFYAPLFTELKYYDVQIIAVGDDGYSTIDSNPFSIRQETKQLQTPDFTLSYSADSYTEEGKINVTITKESPYANGYVYTVGGATYEVKDTVYSYNPNATGTFAVRVYAKGGNFDENGVYYLDSQSQGGNARYSITLLASPNKDSITCNPYDGLVQWGAVPGADKYEVQIYINNALVETVTSYGASLGLYNYVSEVKTGDVLTVVVCAQGNAANIITSKTVENSITIRR